MNASDLTATNARRHMKFLRRCGDMSNDPMYRSRHYSAEEFLRALQAENERLKNTPRCEHCGSDRIVTSSPGCAQCGAPSCCQTCCEITTLQAENERLREEVKRLIAFIHDEDTEAVAIERERDVLKEHFDGKV